MKMFFSFTVLALVKYNTD